MAPPVPTRLSLPACAHLPAPTRHVAACQDATNACQDATKSKGSNGPVKALSQCVGKLAAWGMLQRTHPHSNLQLGGDGEKGFEPHELERLCRAAYALSCDAPISDVVEDRRSEEEGGALPKGVRAGTQQARAWLFVAPKFGAMLEHARDGDGPSEDTAAGGADAAASECDGAALTLEVPTE